MSRGPGQTQRAMLTALADADAQGRGEWIGDLADLLGITRRQAHTAARSLERAGLAHCRLRGWRDGFGERGPLVYWVNRWWPREPVTADTPGARLDEWGNWCAPGGTPHRALLVCLGPAQDSAALANARRFRDGT